MQRAFRLAPVVVAFLIMGVDSQLVAQTVHWNLQQIVASSQGFGLPRQSKVLPLETREKKDNWWQRADRATGRIRKLEMEILFSDLKSEVRPNDNVISLDSKVTSVVNGPGPGFATMQCSSFVKTSSGFEKGDIGSDALNALSYRIPDGERTSMDCAPRIINTLPKEDFVLTLRVAWFDGSPRTAPVDDNGDLTFQFFYKWGGSSIGGDDAGGGKCLEDAGVGSADRNEHYAWAQRQDARTLLSDLGTKAGSVLQCPSMTAEKLASRFADVSVVIAKWVPRAACFGGDNGAVNSDWTAHKNWAAGQSRAVTLSNLQGKLSAAFGCLSREQQNSFYADVSIAIARGAS